DEIVSVRLVAVPSAHFAAQERDFVFDLLPVFGIRCTTGLGLRPIRAGRSCVVYDETVGSLGMCLHFRKFHTKTGKNTPIPQRDTDLLRQTLVCDAFLTQN